MKKLFSIPGIGMVTTKQVAEFYGVEPIVVHRCYERNTEEITNDGVRLIKSSDSSERDGELDLLLQQAKRMRHRVLSVHSQGEVEIQYDNGNVAMFSNRGTRVFSKRSVLRIGMLLRDSEVAKEIRTPLLNVFDMNVIFGHIITFS